LIFNHVDYIYLLAHQANSRVLLQDYDSTLTDLYQIECNVRSICKYKEGSKKMLKT